MSERYPLRPIFPADLAEAYASNLSVGCSPRGAEIMAPKMLHVTLRVDMLSSAAANVIKQQCLSAGCEAVEHQNVILGDANCSSALITGDLRHFRLLAAKLAPQPWGLGMLGESLLAMAELLCSPGHVVLRWRDKTLDLTRPLVVAVVNLTPDSFSDGGSYPTVESAVEHALRCEQEGAGALELGGESTRPASAPVSEKEERERVLPVLEKLRAATSLPIIIDTRKPAVAQACLAVGADCINDVTAMRDPAMRKLVAELKAGAILMHMQGEPGTMQQSPQYSDVVAEIGRELVEAAEACASEGVARNAIAIDPGIGFGKTLTHNLEIMHRLREMTCWGYPIMLGLSRKRMIGDLTGVQEPAERLFGTLGGVIAAAERGALLLRVHDVQAAVQALAVHWAIASYRRHAE